MLVQETSSCFNKLQIDLELVKKSINEIQKLIYLASKEYDLLTKYKYQRKLLFCRKEILVTVLSHIVDKIKKKHIFLYLTRKNCLL